MVNNDKNRSKAPDGIFTERTVFAGATPVAQILAGERDLNLQIIERELEVEIIRNQTDLVIRGLDAHCELSCDLINQLRALIESGEQIYPGDIERSLKLLAADRNLKLVDFFREQIRIAGRKNSIVPKTPNQKIYLEAIEHHDIVFGVGPAGTGKTYLAMAMAISALLKKQVKRVVLCRPAVEAGEKLGFLPGDMAEKVNPYLRPLYDALHDMVDYDKAHEMVEKGIVEVAPLAFMRGRTLSKAFVVLDEAQNTSRMQMKMLLTRLGLGSKCVITGDLSQTDLPPNTPSGLNEALKLLNNIRGIAIVNFNDQDVIRHALVAQIVNAYDKAEKLQ